ncbi:hypothetical protein LCGC14_1635360 [marine sediment metagenome]|uniref:C2H2-type domain-containing protein n=1 Tax=marine sediment metagenome TaxID=412755 RepID=A0A0F9KH00_9ZZZZ
MKDIKEPVRNFPSYHGYSPRQLKRHTCVACQKRFFDFEKMKEHQTRMHTSEEITTARQKYTKAMEVIQRNKLTNKKDGGIWQ